MNYFFRFFVQYSNFFKSILRPKSKIYFNASYLYNFKETCYNLLLKKNFDYFIDPETYKFQFGGNKPFYLKYLEYYKDLEEFFNETNQINFEILENPTYFNDFYKIVIRFQQKILAHSHIPFDYYMSIANGNNSIQHFNPNEKLLFSISPYFEFNEINDESFRYTKRFAQKDSQNYVILRFRKELLLNSENIKIIAEDFKNSQGILINIIDLNEYIVKDLARYFPNLIDLIYKLSSNNQLVILMNNSEFGKYFKYFGLNAVCSNVMIGQTTEPYDPFKTEKRGGSTNFAYIPQIHRSISFNSSEILIKRNSKLANIYPNGVSGLDLNVRIDRYYEVIQDKTKKINKMDFEKISKENKDSFNEITYSLHKNQYKYMEIWFKILEDKYLEYFMKK